MMQQTEPVIAMPSGGYETSRLNATKHGLLSRHLVLPWEDQSEYEGLLDTLIQEHTPSGPTEAHLVEELAGTMWRRQRLVLVAMLVNTQWLTKASVVLTNRIVWFPGDDGRPAASPQENHCSLVWNWSRTPPPGRCSPAKTRHLNRKRAAAARARRPSIHGPC